MKLPRFGRLFNGAGGDDEWRDYTMKEGDQWYAENWWEEEERTKREADIKRGSWVVSAQLTQEEEQEWREFKYNNNYYNSEEKTENGETWTENVFKNANIEAKFNALDKKKQDHDATNNYALCRLAPREYYEVKDRVLRDGIGKQWVRFETHGILASGI